MIGIGVKIKVGFGIEVDVASGVMVGFGAEVDVASGVIAQLGTSGIFPDSLSMNSLKSCRSVGIR